MQAGEVLCVLVQPHQAVRLLPQYRSGVEKPFSVVFGPEHEHDARRSKKCCPRQRSQDNRGSWDLVSDEGSDLLEAPRCGTEPGLNGDADVDGGIR